MQNYSDFGIIPALVLCAHTFHGMQVYIQLSEKMPFPLQQEQTYVKHITGMAEGWGCVGTHKYLKKIN